MKSKMKFLSWMLFSVLFVTSFTSCKDDDEKDIPADKVVGTYTGTIDGEFVANEMSISGENVKIVISKISDDKVKLTLNQTILGMPVVVECDATVQFVTVENISGYAIYGSTSSFNLNGQSVPGRIEIDGGVIQNTNNLSLYIDITETPDNQYDMWMDYEGSK